MHRKDWEVIKQPAMSNAALTFDLSTFDFRLVGAIHGRSQVIRVEYVEGTLRKAIEEKLGEILRDIHLERG